MDCLFCKIIDGQIPSYKIYEDENVLAFLDIFPASVGHTLVVSKRHEDHIFDLSDENYTKLMMATKKIGTHLREKLSAERVLVLVEGFLINHVHVHLIPSGSARSLAELDAGRKKAEDIELKKLQHTLRLP